MCMLGIRTYVGVCTCVCMGIGVCTCVLGTTVLKYVCTYDVRAVQSRSAYVFPSETDGHKSGLEKRFMLSRVEC